MHGFWTLLLSSPDRASVSVGFIDDMEVQVQHHAMKEARVRLRRLSGTTPEGVRGR